MTKILVVTDLQFKVDVEVLKDMVKEDVSLNSVNPDGITIFECGEAVPKEDWDFVVLIGNCLMEMDFTIDITIPLEDDPMGNLIAAISTVKEGQETDEAIGDE
jgi:hypothetical protein